METETNNTNSKSRGKFRSYYVVWKPQVGSEEKKSSQRFKSYYVVWKLISELI